MSFFSKSAANVKKVKGKKERKEKSTQALESS
jgi:hypothetical protein